ncbi:MAG: PAS domain S-box protein [Desulfobulbaceae bacterium]|nr:PAS domain S-box protein [Desulfobulbaceae bacterium]
MEKQKLDELHRRAKERLDSERGDSPENAGDEVRKLLHELRTYQIELELQNDELRRVQEELVETRDQYIDLYDFAPFGYLTLSDKGVIVKANLTLADLLGEERGVLHGQPFTRFIFYDDQDRFYTYFRAFIAPMDRLVFDLRMQSKDGDWFWAKLECIPRTKNEMSGSHIRIALHDITDAKRLENEIIKTKKLEATALLAGGIAHDFNNLLAVIMGNLEVAQEKLRKGRPVADKLQVAQNACLHAAELTKKFLTFSSGGEPLITSVPAETLVSDAVTLALAGSNVDFESFFPEGLRPVAVDIGQMT